MKKDIRVIALDLDGTLFNSQKEVSQHTKDVLAECSRRGIIVMPATGRPATGFPHVLEAVPSFRYALTSNGALVYDFAEKKGIYEDTISVENALKVVEFTRKYDVMCDAYIGGYGYSEKDKLANIANYFQTQKMIDYVLSTRIPVDDMGKFIRENGVGVEKLVCFFGDLSLQDKLAEDLAQFDFLKITRALVNNVELNNATCNKGESLLQFAAHMGFTREQTMACGDGNNDLDMIRAAGFGVAMDNAAPEVKEAADYITLSNDDDGVAAVIEKYVL
ncbi:MAG: HAD family phosphatase [Clostridia bacterium]|nr:HAD family phosphatase [Clostridia bacterium]